MYIPAPHRASRGMENCSPHPFHSPFPAKTKFPSVEGTSNVVSLRLWENSLTTPSPHTVQTKVTPVYVEGRKQRQQSSTQPWSTGDKLNHGESPHSLTLICAGAGDQYSAAVYIPLLVRSKCKEMSSHLYTYRISHLCREQESDDLWLEPSQKVPSLHLAR